MDTCCKGTVSPRWSFLSLVGSRWPHFSGKIVEDLAGFRKELICEGEETCRCHEALQAATLVLVASTEVRVTPGEVISPCFLLL